MQAAEVAREAGAKRLLLNHQCSLLIKRHQSIAQGCVQHFENVYVVKDLEEVEI